MGLLAVLVGAIAVFLNMIVVVLLVRDRGGRLKLLCRMLVAMRKPELIEYMLHYLLTFNWLSSESESLDMMTLGRFFPVDACASRG